MKTMLSFLCSLLISTVVLSQSKTQKNTIIGKITDITNETLPYATVILQDINDKLIQGVVTNENGDFIFTNINTGNYTIETQYIGFITEKRTIVVNDKTKKINLGTLILKEDANLLDEVVVEGEVSEISLKLGKKVFRVGKDITAQSGAATDVLNNVPSVNVGPTGTITLRGNANVQVLINGRRSGLTQSQALEQLSADVIETIEVITNPSAKYDASGGAGIINIILKKNKMSGLNGQVRLVSGIPDDYRAFGNVNYKTEKFNFFTNLGIRYTDYEGDYSKEQQTTDNGVTTFLNQNEDEDRHDDGQIFYFGTDFYANDNNTFTLAYFRNETQDTDKTELFYDISTNENNTETSLFTLGNSKEERAYNQLEANYTKTFEKKGKRLTVDFQYDFWNSTKKWDLITDETFPTTTNIATIKTLGNTNTDDIRIQSDYKIPINEKSNLEVGVKFENRTINNDFLAEELIDNNFETIDGINNNLEYKEKITSGYAQFNSKRNKFNYQLGLRLESTAVTINSASNILNIKNDYTNLFPSATVGYEFKDNLSGQLSYSKRIKRPSLWQLNPFFELKDYTARFTGNPLLNPSYTDAYELSFMYNSKKITINPSIYFSKTKDVFQDETIVDSAGVFIQYPINLDSENRVGLELSISYKPLKWLRFSSDFNAYTFDQTGILNEENAAISDATWSVNFSTSIQPSKTLKLQTRVYHIGEKSNAQTTTKGITYVNIAASKSILKNKGSIIFNVFNPFNSSQTKEYITGDNFQINQIRNRNAQRFSLSFVYKFNQKASDKNRSAKRSNRN